MEWALAPIGKDIPVLLGSYDQRDDCSRASSRLGFQVSLIRTRITRRMGGVAVWRCAHLVDELELSLDPVDMLQMIRFPTVRAPRLAAVRDCALWKCIVLLFARADEGEDGCDDGKWRRALTTALV